MHAVTVCERYAAERGISPREAACALNMPPEVRDRFPVPRGLFPLAPSIAPTGRTGATGATVRPVPILRHVVDMLGEPLCGSPVPDGEPERDCRACRATARRQGRGTAREVAPESPDWAAWGAAYAERRRALGLRP